MKLDDLAIIAVEGKKPPTGEICFMDDTGAEMCISAGP